MSYPKIGEFRETRYNDSIHEVFDAGLQFGATLHRFINAGGTECSAIYVNGAQIWWVYTNGNALGDSESVMIKDWQNLDPVSRPIVATIRVNKMADQEARQARYPYDRIAFVPSAAAADSKDLNDYKYGLISFDTLRAHIAYNNYLDGLYPDGIPEVAMRKFLSWSGWERRHE